MQDKVVFVNLRLTGGGAEKVMSMLASYYAEAGIGTEMILLQDKERTYSISDKVKLIECYCPQKGNKLLWHIKRIFTIRKALKKSDADTIISFMWDINFKVILASLGLHKRVIISERADPNSVSRKKALKFAQKFIFPLADVLVFQTEQVMNCYPKNVRKKSIVIPNPIPKVVLKDDVVKQKYIIAAGRICEQKNFEMLIKAFAIFSENHSDYSLRIFGQGDLEQNLRNLSSELNVEDKVEFPGFVANLNDYMQEAAIYASSSNYEGISNAMLEAITMGIPAVCTDCPVGGAAMVIKNRENGILVEVGDYNAMAKAFTEIVDNKEFADKLSRSAIESSKLFTLEKIAKKWMEL